MVDRFLRLVCVALLGLAALAACGGEEEDGGIPQSGDVVSTTEAPSTTAPPAEPTVLEVGADDFSFDTAGVTSVPAGVLELTLVNEGAEEHQATLLRLNDGVTADQFDAAVASDPSGRAALGLVRASGGPNAVPPDGEATTSSLVEEGDYLMVCIIPSPSDGVPHSAKGMVTPLTVTEAEGTVPELEEGEGVITASDFEWELPEEFAGSGTYTFANDGPQVHELAAYRLDAGTTLAALQPFLSPTPPPGAPPFTPAGGVAAMTRGVSSTIEFDLEPGTYAFICFLPDTAADGAPHFTKGMIQEVTIS